MNSRKLFGRLYERGERAFDSIHLQPLAMIKEAALTWQLLADARRSSRRPASWLRSRQEAGLRRLLRHAYARVPMYRKLYDEAGFHPEMFRSLEDLHRIPPLSKRHLKDSPISDTLAIGTKLADCEPVSTSGSTGMPLQIWLGAYERCWHRAVAWRILFEHGFGWADRTMEIRMTAGRIYPLQRLGIAPKSWLSILDPPSDWVNRLAAVRHDCIMAGAGTLDILATEAAAAGDRVPPPRLVISDSEPLTATVRNRIRNALGSDPVDVYGLVEVSNFAWQCECRCGLHVSGDSHVVEVDAPAGQQGALIVTALGMATMPIIRYQTGDLAEFATEPCPCGRSLPLLKSVVGRAIDSIRLGGGEKLLWPFFHEVLGRIPMIQEWQVEQLSPRKLVIRTVLAKGCSDSTLPIQAALRSQLPSGLAIRVEAVRAIPLETNGKRRLIIPLPD